MPIKTRYGYVDETAFEAFQDDFDTDRILRAIDNLDRVAHGVTMMQEELRTLHRMAEELMTDDLTGNAPDVPDSASIWMLAEDISMRAWEWPALIEAATDIADEVAKLAPDPDAEWEEED
ncbi:hypothetical protein [Serratia marcescens]|uniref:hypothetical protein n=1 Tax=Serratia marcescens TaxID=615 RepID=UPI003A8A509D